MASDEGVGCGQPADPSVLRAVCLIVNQWMELLSRSLVKVDVPAVPV